jgi:NADH dehydrogenase/NADH:ubiquinone oxidoreductase subunit G
MKLPMPSRIWKVLRRATLAVCGLAVVVALLPSKARSQLGLDPCCAMMQVGLNTISGLLRNAVAMPLGSIQQSQQQSANFEQQVVFPMAAITQARNMAVQFEGQFVQMRQLFQLPISSATLRAPQLLEQSLLSANPGAMPQITSNYSALYGTVMPPANAPQSVRNMVDMTDAEAQAAMKKAVEIDALANLELQAAEQINQQLQTAAPGSSTILEAETAAWLVRANAYTQSAMAELVRVRSIELANSGGQLKFSASHTATLQTTGGQVLQQGVQ